MYVYIYIYYYMYTIYRGTAAAAADEIAPVEARLLVRS